MAQTPHTPPAAAARRESPRVRLARLATAAARSHAEVTGLDARAQYATSGPSGVLPGVVAAADDDGSGRIAIALYLTAAPTDLHALSSAVQATVRSSADAAGLAGELASVHVTFTDLTLSEEIDHP